MIADGVLRPHLVIIGVPYLAPGDTNGDDIVDELDYANLVAQFGSLPGAENADFNGDGLVDLDDFAIMRAYFGYGVAAASDAEFRASVPEPGTLGLIALAGLAVLRRRWK